MRLLCVLLVVVVVNAKLAPHYLAVGTGVGMPDVVKGKYHDTDTLLNLIDTLSSNCKYLTKHEIQATDPLTGAPRTNVAYTLTDPDMSKESKKRFMLTFGMHGREYISSETALNLAQFTCETMSPKSSNGPSVSTTSTKNNKPQFLVETGVGLSMDQSRVGNILKATEIVFVPVLNIDGRHKVEAGSSCTEQRKNGRSVDVNRNFADWFNPNNALPSDEDYQGPAAMSEWESNIVKTLAQQFRPHAFIDVHSGDLGMGYVYGHSGVERSPDDSLNQNWVSMVDQEVFGGKVWNGNLANMGSMPYESHGSSCDYMYRTQGARISGTWEVWKKSSFFADNSNSNTKAASNAVSGVNSEKISQMNNAASKYDYVSTTVTPIEVVNDNLNVKQAKALTGSPAKSQAQNALIPNTVVGQGKESSQVLFQNGIEVQSLVQLGLDADGNSEVLGLTRDEMQSLVETMKSNDRDGAHVQELLQDMSREQCFAYFNPILPEHYDSTVTGFTYAILVGAEKLSAPAISVAFK